MASKQIKRRLKTGSPKTSGVIKEVDASPVKSFFVVDLTRDISLIDVILDLLDNCIDGVLRKKGKAGGNNLYRGFKASIEFNPIEFKIKDNCGGIPEKLHPYAFRMGKVKGSIDNGLPTVGTYGIGMKRAIFKLGENCIVDTQTKRKRYQFHISQRWMQNEDDWNIPFEDNLKSRIEDGTEITIDNLRPDIAKIFEDTATTFETDLHKTISRHYAFIINKGFQVFVNNKKVLPKPIKIAFEEPENLKIKTSIRPFIYKTTINNVSVFLMVGFTQPIPGEQEAINNAIDEQEGKSYSYEDTGWTVICNDRVVLYNDKSAHTGWGTAGVPKHHNQFNEISGIVEFQRTVPELLTTTTTKIVIDRGNTP